MADDVRTLNDLLEMESDSLVAHLAQARPFVAPADAGRLPVLQGMLADETEHRRWLTDTIERLNGALHPPQPGESRSQVQYLDLRYLLPKVIDQKQRAVDAYRTASADLADSAASEVANAILPRHEAHLAELRAMMESDSAPADA